jgi:hypothetical protein
MVRVAVVFGVTVVLTPVAVAVAGPVQGWVVVGAGGIVVDVDVVVVGFFLFGIAGAALDDGWADTATPVPRRTAPATRATTPSVPNLCTTNLERLTAASDASFSCRPPADAPSPHTVRPV